MSRDGIPTVLVHVECLMGTGELSHARDYVRELVDQGVRVKVFSGHLSHYFDSLHGKVEFVNDGSKEHLPPPRIRHDFGSGHYFIVDPRTGEEHDVFSPKAEPLLKRREAMLCAAANDADAIVHVSGWPFWLGKGLLDREMYALEKHLRDHDLHPAKIHATREVLWGDSPQAEGGWNAIARYFDTPDPVTGRTPEWHVFGDENLIDISASTDNARLARHARYVGYALPDLHPAPHHRTGEPAVLLTPGGGDFREQSVSLLLAGIHAYGLLRDEEEREARQPRLTDRPWKMVVGDNYPAVYRERIREAAAEVNARFGCNGETDGIVLTPPLVGKAYADAFDNCDVYIGHSGMGTFRDLLHYTARSVLVPLVYHTPSVVDEDGTVEFMHFREQAVRARVLADHGKVEVLLPERMYGDSVHGPDILRAAHALSESVVRAAHMPYPDFSHVRCNGNTESVGQLLEMIGYPSRRVKEMESDVALPRVFHKTAPVVAATL